jgi:hypothetical protein
MKYLIILVIFLVMGIGGCTQGQENPVSPQSTLLTSKGIQSGINETAPDIAAIFQKQSQLMKSVTTCQSNLYSKIYLKSPGSPDKNISITIDINSYIDVPNRQMNSLISNKISMSGDSRSMTQQIVATGDKIFFRESDAANANTSWQVKDLDKAAADALWNEQDAQITGSKYTEQISPQSFVYSGMETINGHTCYVFKQPLNNQTITEIAPELLDQIQTAEDFSQDALAEMLKNIELVCLIDEQSYLREIRIIIRIDQLVQGHQVSGTIEQYCRLDKFNEPVSIQIPIIK